MIKIGITGSLASGKTTASRILSSNRGPLYSADEEVKKLYKDPNFKKKLSNVLKLRSKINFKSEIIKKISTEKKALKNLEKLVHPLVRKKMLSFLFKNKNKGLLFFEIPLLIEKNLNKFFDIIIFIQAEKSCRLKRYLLKGGNKSLFDELNKKQLRDAKKIKFCDYVVVNNGSLNVLKKKLSNIIRFYE